MKNLTYLLLITIIFSCQVKRVDTTAVKKRMQDYKVRRISDADVLTTAETWGQAIKSDIIAKPALLCDTTFIVQEAKIQALTAPYKVANASAKLKNIIEAYNYSASQNQPLPENIQQINDSTVLYSYQNTLKTANCKPSLILMYLPYRLILRKIK